MIREQWLCTALYFGIKVGSIGLKSGLRPNVVADDGRLLKDDLAGALLGPETSVGCLLVASLLVHDIGEAPNHKAYGRPCV